MKILGVYNIKGGVGKTATAVNLGHLAASSGLRTLIWDLDPQAAATFYLRVKPKVKDTTKILRGKRDLDDVVQRDLGLDLLGGLDDGADVLPVDVLHREEVVLAVLADVVDVDDVGVIQRGRQERLVPEHAHELGILGEMRQDPLEDHHLAAAVVMGGPREVQLRHASDGEPPEDLVARAVHTARGYAGHGSLRL